MCHIRIGPSASPAISAGEADILLALEMSEVLRALPLARPGVLAFINTYRRVPITAGVAGIHYPAQSEVQQALKEHAVAQRLPLFAEQNLHTFAAGWHFGEEYRLNREKHSLTSRNS